MLMKFTKRFVQMISDRKLDVSGLAYVIPGTSRYGPFRSFASFDNSAVFEFGQLLLRATEAAYASPASRRSCKSDVNNACKPHVQS